MIKNKHKKLFFVTTFLISGVFICINTSSSIGYAASVPPLASFDPQVIYPSNPVNSTPNSDLYVDLRFHTYSNHSPMYYDSDPTDGQSEIDKTPYFMVVITKNGQEVYRCRNDYPIYDTCGGNYFYDNNPTRGQSYTYSAYVEYWQRNSGCSLSVNGIDPDCGKGGSMKGASPAITKTVYIGTENPPRMDAKLSYNGKVLSPYPSADKVPIDEALTFTWLQYDAAGSQYSGDAPHSCDLYEDGKIIHKDIGANGSLVVQANATLGIHTLSVNCINGAGPDATGGDSAKYEAVEALPDNYYNDNESTGGGGVGVAIPEGNYLGDLDGNGAIDSEQDNLTNIFNTLSGTYVSMSVQGCSTTSSGFTAPNNNNLAQEQDSGYEYPFGVMSFTLNCDKPGSTSTITKYYYTSLLPQNAELRKYNAKTGIFSTIDSADISSVSIGGRKALKVSYKVTDGGPFDEDNSANGVIIDPVGLASIGLSTEQVNQLQSTNNGIFNSACNQVQDSQKSPFCNSASSRPLVGQNSIVSSLISLFSIVIGTVAVIMLTIGGFKYVVSSGDSNSIESAKNTIMFAIIGLAIAATAQVLVRFVLSTLT